MRSIIIGTLLAALAGCANFEGDDSSSDVSGQSDFPDYDGDGTKGDEDQVFAVGANVYIQVSRLPTSNPDDLFVVGHGLGGKDDWCTTQLGLEVFDGQSDWPKYAEHGYLRAFLPGYVVDGCINVRRIDDGDVNNCRDSDDGFNYWGRVDDLLGQNVFAALNPNDERRVCLAVSVHDNLVLPGTDNQAILPGNPDNGGSGDTDTNGSTERECCVDADGDGYGTSSDCILVDVSDACPSGRVSNDNDLCDTVGGCGTGGGGGSGGDSSGYGQCAAGESAVRATFTAPASIVSFQLDERDGVGVSGTAKPPTTLLFGKIVPGGQSGTITGPSDPTTVVGSVSGNTATLTANLCLTDDFTVFASGEYSGGKYLCEGSGTRNGSLVMDVDGTTVTPVVWQNPSGGCELMYHVTGNEVGGGGSSTFYCDNDGDGYKSKWSSTSCTGSSSTTAGADCGDNDGNVYPGATERLNGIDDNCNGTADEGLSAGTDVDHDGYTVAGGDCNDNVASVHQGANEVVGDGIDQDCNGHDSCYVNNDQDLYGTSGTIDAVGLTCTQLQGRATVSGDCNDSNPSIYPTAIEVSNGLDDNCDGTIDNVGSGGSNLFGQCTGNTAAVRVAWDALYDASSLQIEVYSGVITSGQAKSGTQLGLSRIQGSSITGTAAIGHTAGHHVELTMQPCFPLPFTVFTVGQDASGSYSISSNGTVSGVTSVYVDRGSDGTSNPSSVTPQPYVKYGGTGYEYSYVVQ